MKMFFVFLIVHSGFVMGQGNFKITYPYNISSLEVNNNKLLIGDDQGFVELDTALNLIQEYRLPTPFAHPYCTYGNGNTNPQVWGTRYQGALGFYVSGSVCLPNAGPNYYNRIHISKVNYEDTLALSILDGEYYQYCSTFLSANRLCLLVTQNPRDFCAYDYNLSKKWSFSLPYPWTSSGLYARLISLYDSLNFAINLNDSVFVVVDSAANFIYKKKHTISTLRAIKKVDQNTKLICGQINQEKGVVVCMTDNNFNPLWSKQFFMPDSAKNIVEDLFVDTNQDIYITTNSSDSMSFVIRLDNQGNILAHKQLENSSVKTRIGSVDQYGNQIVLNYLLLNNPSTERNIVIGLDQDLTSSCFNFNNNIGINSANFNFIIEDDTTSIPVTYYSANTTFTATPTFINSQAHTMECNSIGAHELYNQATLNVYPNPFKDKIKIESSEDIDRVSIKNLMGAEVESVLVKNADGELTIETLGIANGIYILSVYKNGQRIGTKKVVQNND